MPLTTGFSKDLQLFVNTGVSKVANTFVPLGFSEVCNRFVHEAINTHLIFALFHKSKIDTLYTGVRGLNVSCGVFMTSCSETGYELPPKSSVLNNRFILN
jgi:hypothetical protein